MTTINIIFIGLIAFTVWAITGYMIIKGAIKAALKEHDREKVI